MSRQAKPTERFAAVTPHRGLPGDSCSFTMQRRDTRSRRTHSAFDGGVGAVYGRTEISVSPRTDGFRRQTNKNSFRSRQTHAPYPRTLSSADRYRSFLTIESFGVRRSLPMRIGILSDTHDEIERTQLAIDVLRSRGVDGLIHCGDLASPAIVEMLGCLPSWFVFGNHDSDSVPDLQRAAVDFGVNCLGWHGSIELAGAKIGVVHGHLTRDVRTVLGSHPDYLLSGHAHFPSDATIDSIRRINPGALHRAESYTVVWLDLASGSLQLLKIE